MFYRAGFCIRAGATLVDAVVLIAINVVVGSLYLAIHDPLTTSARSDNVAVACIWSAWLAYSTMEIFFGGTLGKKLFGLRIARLDGSDDRWSLFLRWQTKQLPFIAAVAFALTQVGAIYLLGGLENGLVLIGCLFAANDDCMAWHDQWSGTAVFHAKALRTAQRIPEGEWAEIL